MAVKWLQAATVGMQRVGALVAAAAISGSRPVPLERFSQQLSDALNHAVIVPAERSEQLEAYVRGLALRQRVSVGPDKIPIQDAWLSDPTLPSATGAVTPAASGDIPQLAASLRIVRDANYTLTDRGKAVRLLADESNQSVLQHRWEPNPYRVSLGLGLFVIHALLDADGDMVRHAYARLLSASPPTVRRYDFAVQFLDGAAEDLWRRAGKRLTSTSDVQLINGLKALSKAIQDTDRTKKNAKTWGGGRSPDQAATVRLEPYADLGLLTKPSRFEYEYSLSVEQRSFFSDLIEASDVAEFLRSHLVCSYLNARGIPNARRLTDEEIWQRLASAYGEMRTALGYAAFQEVVLLAIGRVLNENNAQYFEVADGIDVIRKQQRLTPRAVQLTATRGGGLRYMRIVESRRAS